MRAGRARARFFVQEKPRLSVFRSNKFIYAQLIDDQAGKTLASGSDRDLKSPNKTGRAKELGKVIADKIKKAGIETIVFDKGSYKYHGRVKAVAEGAREGGLKF